jgi:hypothetical protein
LGMIFLILKTGPIRKVLLLDVAIDIGFTGILMLTMAGTFTGIIVAILAGAMLSVVLYVLKLIFPPQSLTAKGWTSPRTSGAQRAFQRVFHLGRWEVTRKPKVY